MPPCGLQNFVGMDQCQYAILFRTDILWARRSDTPRLREVLGRCWVGRIVGGIGRLVIGGRDLGEVIYRLEILSDEFRASISGYVAGDGKLLYAMMTGEEVEVHPPADRTSFKAVATRYNPSEGRIAITATPLDFSISPVAFQ